jgi:parallel beta-helix repeat protein
MKSKLIFPAMLLVAAIFASCQKQEIESSENSRMNSSTENGTFKKIAPISFNIQQYQQLMTANKARLALLENQPSFKSTMTSITVPSDYETIQEAVDAAPENANIFVNAGTYTEDVIISTPGLKIQARNGVQLNGGFTIAEGTDNVTIKKFNIDATNNALGTGILGLYANGCQVVQNTITAIPANLTFDQNGIAFISSDGNTFSANNITGVDWGICIWSMSIFGDNNCNGNTILNNTISGNYVVGIQLQGNCDNNTIKNNTISNGSAFGITLYGVPDNMGDPEIVWGDCNDNVVKNNNCSNTASGITFYFECSNNTLGPNNICNNNLYYGIYFYGCSSDNLVFNNTALNNLGCDIWIESSPGNTFNNNTYNCLTEL